MMVVNVLDGDCTQSPTVGDSIFTVAVDLLYSQSHSKELC